MLKILDPQFYRLTEVDGISGPIVYLSIKGPVIAVAPAWQGYGSCYRLIALRIR